METVVCNFCKSSNYKIVATQTDIVHGTTNNFFNIVECKDCGLNFTNPRPSINEIHKFYPKNYDFFKKNNLILSLIRNLISYLANSYWGYFFSYIPFINTRLKSRILHKSKNPILLNNDQYFLDIGAGSGETSYWWGYKGSVKYYSKISKNIFAVEPDLIAQNRLNKNNIKVFKVIEDIPDNLTFHFIRMNWSLEHVHNPEKYFKFLSDHLDTQGKAIITIPNYSGLIYLMDKTHVELPIHLFHFKIKDIENFSNKFNLLISKYETFSFASMYYSASYINDNFKDFKKYSLIDLKLFQKNLKELDKFNLGNDMMIELRKKIF
jgi:SAM-dependent methyltransferase